MAYRKRMSRGKSRRSFARSTLSHPQNDRGAHMRGGIRL